MGLTPVARPAPGIFRFGTSSNFFNNFGNLFPLYRERSKATFPHFGGPRPGSAWYSSQCFIEGDHRDINVSLALCHRVFCLKLSALGI
jgi:hypothetical protein